MNLSTLRSRLAIIGLSAALPFASIAATSADKQKAMTPQQAFEKLLAGNDRYTSGVTSHRDLSSEVAITSKGQFPFGVVLTCLDSRTTPENMFDQGVGDLFVGRIAGNFAADDMIGSFEFAHKLAGSKVLAVIGHSSCGAVKGACDGAKMGNLTHTLAQLSPAIEAVPNSVKPRNSKNPAFVQKVADANVRLTVDRILDRSDVLSDMVKAGELGVIGGMYDLNTGKVTFYEDTAHGLKMPH